MNWPISFPGDNYPALSVPGISLAFFCTVVWMQFLSGLLDGSISWSPGWRTYYVCSMWSNHRSRLNNGWFNENKHQLRLQKLALEEHLKHFEKRCICVSFFSLFRAIEGSSVTVHGVFAIRLAKKLPALNHVPSPFPPAQQPSCAFFLLPNRPTQQSRL